MHVCIDTARSMSSHGNNVYKAIQMKELFTDNRIYWIIYFDEAGHFHILHF